VPLAGWWAAMIFIGLTLAGEKMPWLATHIAIPFILLAAWLWTLVSRAWSAVRRGNPDLPGKHLPLLHLLGCY
jgi:predicted membrane-bound mannosyltransferase